MTSEVTTVREVREVAVSHAAGQMARFERCIAGAERHIEEQESRIREAALAGCNTAVDDFNLQKMHLLLAILREGRDRVVERLRAAS